MSWSAAQLRMLAAMGYEPMQRRAAGESLAASPAPTTATAMPMAAAPPSRRSAPPPPRIDAPAPARATGNPAAFAAALRRAAGDRDVAALVDDLERLRRDPALKRALWPRLRALRRLQ